MLGEGEHLHSQEGSSLGGSEVGEMQWLAGRHIGLLIVPRQLVLHWRAQEKGGILWWSLFREKRGRTKKRKGVANPIGKG